MSSYTLGDPTGTGNAAGASRTLQRDAAGRITGYSHTGNGATGLDQTFAYDNLNRLTAATQGASSTSYSYDATGNRTQKSVGGTAYTNTISPSSNRMTQVGSPAGSAAFSHDPAGNVAADGSATFSYSDRGRMASATTSAGTVNYLYDGRNQRARKSGPGSLVNTGEGYFVYDEAGQLLGEYDTTGKPVYETIYLGSTPVGAMKQAGTAAGNDLTTNLHNVYADHIDTPRIITKQDHTIVWRWDTAEAFGSTAPNQNPSGLGAFVFNQRFPGQVFDQETGLFQNWNREYDSWIGRYNQSDPIGLAGGINTFLYVGGNPTLRMDPTGLAEQGDLLSKAKKMMKPAYDLWGVISGRKSAEKRACLCNAILKRKQAYEELMGKLGSGQPMTPWDNEALMVLDRQRKLDAITASEIGLQYSLDLYVAIGTSGGMRGLPLAAAEMLASSSARPQGYDTSPHAPGRGSWTLPVSEECDE